MQLVNPFTFTTIILFFIPTFSADTTWPKVIDPLMTVRRSYHSQHQTSTSSSSSSSKVDEKECVECNQNKVVVNDQNPILTELRVEYVKQQILKKLRLSKPPNVSISLSTLPKPLINGNVLELRPGAPLEPEKSAESFYGKTDQIVVFPYEGKDNRMFNFFSYFIYFFFIIYFLIRHLVRYYYQYNSRIKRERRGEKVKKKKKQTDKERKKKREKDLKLK